MAFYEIGKTIRLNRECDGHTLETLSEGICSSQTLYRIEKGRSKIKSEYLERFINKLSMCQEHHNCVFIDDSPRTMELKSQIQSAISRFEYKKATLLLKELELNLGNSTVTRQYLMREHCIIDFAAKRYDAALYVSQMMRALELTVGDVEKHMRKVYPFRLQEIMILINVAGKLPELHNRADEAHRIYRLVLRVLTHSYICGKDAIHAKIIVLRNYALLFQMEGEYKKGIALENAALRLSINNNYGRHLSAILEGLSCKYYDGLEQAPSQNTINQDDKVGRRILRQAYYVSLARRQFNIATLIKDSYEQKFGSESL